MRKLRIGIVGLSETGLTHLRALQESKKVALVAVCDLDPNVLAKVVEQTGARGFQDYARMFAEADIQGVVLCLPHDIYPDAVAKAAATGLHILKEKPLARSLVEGKQIVELAQTAGVKLMISTQRRFDPIFSRAKDLVKDIGFVFLARAQHVFNCTPRDFGWRSIKVKAGGGAILDIGYHMVDLLVWYLGLPDEVYAYATAFARPDIVYDTDDSAVMMFKYESGTIGYLLTSRVTLPREESLYLHGTSGCLLVSRGKIVHTDYDGNELNHCTADPNWDVALLNQVNHFVDCVFDDRQPLTSDHANLANMAFIEAAYRSSQECRPINPKELLSLSDRGDE